jgi:hypothetical protein
MTWLIVDAWRPGRFSGARRAGTTASAVDTVDA